MESSLKGQKTLRDKEKLLDTSNFYFFPQCFQNKTKVILARNQVQINLHGTSNWIRDKHATFLGRNRSLETALPCFKTCLALICEKDRLVPKKGY